MINQDLTDGQRRVVQEKLDLDKKIEKLAAFLANPSRLSYLSSEEFYDLRVQHEVMVKYSEILGKRIGKFK